MWQLTAFSSTVRMSGGNEIPMNEIPVRNGRKQWHKLDKNNLSWQEFNKTFSKHTNTFWGDVSCLLCSQLSFLILAILLWEKRGLMTKTSLWSAHFFEGGGSISSRKKREIKTFPPTVDLLFSSTHHYRARTRGEKADEFDQNSFWGEFVGFPPVLLALLAEKCQLPFSFPVVGWVLGCLGVFWR